MKVKFPAKNSKQQMAENLNIKLRIVFLNFHILETLFGDDEFNDKTEKVKVAFLQKKYSKKLS